MNDELKNAASPYSKLEKTMAEHNQKLDAQHEELKIHSIMLDDQTKLLSDLCDLKENQNLNDILFRKSWQHGKRKDLLTSIIVIGLASTALYWDVIKVDPAVLGPILRVLGLVL